MATITLFLQGKNTVFFFFPFTKTVIRYINKRTDSTISTKATLETRSLVVITANLVLNLKRHKQLSEKLGNI